MASSFDSQSQISAAELDRLTKEAEQEATPSSAKIMWHQFKRDRAALISLIAIVGFIVFVVVGSWFVDTGKAMNVDIMAYNSPPFSDYLLGADSSGRSIAQQLIVGSRNSICIALGLTAISSTFGVVYGLVSGFFGGLVDLTMQRLYDFMMIIPMLMTIIVIVTIIPQYNAITLTLILSLFYWMGTSRLIRSRTLAESQKDYVTASKTAGSSNLKIMFREILPNISSLIIVDTTLSFAENIGVETGLSFFRFWTSQWNPLIRNVNCQCN